MNHDNRKLPAGLYFVATPIGNARDITLRALDYLASADVLAAEDTRTLRRLMEIHGVPLGDRPLIAYHDHNGDKARPRLLEALAQNRSVVYASEAGTPLIADPGFDLSRTAAEEGYLVTSAPGPSAVAAALTIAGLPTDRFLFAGFLPNAGGARRSALADLADIKATLVLYESPKRIAATLQDAANTLGGDRRAVVCRELTKKFEECRRDTLENLAAAYAGQTVKGEIVLVIDRASSPNISEKDVTQALETALETMSVRDAADFVSSMFKLPRRPIYQEAMRIGGKR